MSGTTGTPNLNKAGTPNLNKALSLLQGEMPKVTKTKTAEVKDQQTNRLLYKYDYADLGDVVADMGPLLAKHGLAFHCAPTRDPADRREMILAWALLHESGEERTGEWPLGPANQKPQSLGSAITYGRRYCFTAATNIVLEDDDDGQRAQQDHGSRQSAGDAWETAAPAPPRQNGSDGGQRDRAPRPAQPRPDAHGDGSGHVPSWVDTATQKAASFETEAEGAALWQEAVGKARKKEITGEDKEGIRVLIGSRVEDLRTKAMNEALLLLSENDDWRLKVQEIDGEVSAREQLLELSRLIAEEGFNMTRANRISQAIIARWPKAREERPAAA